MLTSSALDDSVIGHGCTAHVKAENLQRTGSFKIRGAMNAILGLSDAEAARGVAAHSSGNHAAAVACAARSRGIPCTIVVPRTTAASKIANTERFGARVVLCNPTQQSRQSTVEACAAEMGGATIVHPYNDPAVMAGQGTIGLEMLEDAPDLDCIVVPVSGGGMLAGQLLAAQLKATYRDDGNEDSLAKTPLVFAAEPRGKRLREALEAKTRIVDPVAAEAALDTVADAIITMPLGPNPWTLATAAASSCEAEGANAGDGASGGGGGGGAGSSAAGIFGGVITVDDADIEAAMRATATDLKQVVEPAGAVALAAARKLAARSDTPGISKIGVIACGGNVDLERWAKLAGGVN